MTLSALPPLLHMVRGLLEQSHPDSKQTTHLVITESGYLEPGQELRSWSGASLLKADAVQAKESHPGLLSAQPVPLRQGQHGSRLHAEEQHTVQVHRETSISLPSPGNGRSCSRACSQGCLPAAAGRGHRPPLAAALSRGNAHSQGTGWRKIWPQVLD